MGKSEKEPWERIRLKSIRLFEGGLERESIWGRYGV